MKRILVLLAVCFTSFIIYYDLTTGTLPNPSPAAPAEKDSGKSEPAASISIPYKEVKAGPGDTLLSILEEGGGLTVPIEQAVKDFQELNRIKPEEIQIGRSYKIPSY